jgi:hypothetical protein
MMDLGVCGRRATFAPRKNRAHVAAAPTAAAAMTIWGHAKITEVARSRGELTASEKMVAARIGWNFMANH